MMFTWAFEHRIDTGVYQMFLDAKMDDFLQGNNMKFVGPEVGMLWG